MPALTNEEADDYLRSAISTLVALEDLERPPSRAIPRDVLNCGEAQVLLGALVAMIAEDYPGLVADVPQATDLALRNCRGEH
jgi:hypothetical protein